MSHNKQSKRNSGRHHQNASHSNSLANVIEVDMKSLPETKKQVMTRVSKHRVSVNQILDGGLQVFIRGGDRSVSSVEISLIPESITKEGSVMNGRDLIQKIITTRRVVTVTDYDISSDEEHEPYFTVPDTEETESSAEQMASNAVLPETLMNERSGEQQQQISMVISVRSVKQVTQKTSVARRRLNREPKDIHRIGNSSGKSITKRSRKSLRKTKRRSMRSRDQSVSLNVICKQLLLRVSESVWCPPNWNRFYVVNNFHILEFVNRNLHQRSGKEYEVGIRRTVKEHVNELKYCVPGIDPSHTNIQALERVVKYVRTLPRKQM